MKCIDGCIHYEYDQSLVEQAKEKERILITTLGQNNRKNRQIRDASNVLGYIGQYASISQVQDVWGIDVVSPDYINPDFKGDEYDWMYDNQRIDTKASPLGKFPDGQVIKNVFPKSRFLIAIEHREKPMDYYCFVKVDLEDKLVHIAGVIRFDDFWRDDRIWEKTGRDGNKYTCGYCFAYDLTDLRKFIFRV